MAWFVYSPITKKKWIREATTWTSPHRRKLNLLNQWLNKPARFCWLGLPPYEPYISVFFDYRESRVWERSSQFRRIKAEKTIPRTTFVGFQKGVSLSSLILCSIQWRIFVWEDNRRHFGEDDGSFPSRSNTLLTWSLFRDFEVERFWS